MQNRIHTPLAKCTHCKDTGIIRIGTPDVATYSQPCPNCPVGQSTTPQAARKAGIAQARKARKAQKWVALPMPDIDTLMEWEQDGMCEAMDGCEVEPDGRCEHGAPSWLLAMGLI